MLLILTERSDLAADYLICALRDRCLPHFRLNSEDFGEAEYDVAFDSRGAIRRIFVDGRALDLDQVDVVWYRRQPAPLPPPSVPTDQRGFAAGELLNLAEGLLPLSSARWIDSPAAVWKAERKLQQLALAREVGFTIPATLVSSRRSALLAFFDKHEETGVVCKPVYRSLFLSGSGAHAAYTRTVTIADLLAIAPDEEVFPTLLQQLVPKGADLRITAVGSRFFSARISTPEGAVDWRAPGVEPQYQQAEISKELERTCTRFLDELDLTYGAFDFAEGPDGTPFFLEVNPVGEWAWLDRELDLGIREALVDELYSREAER